MCADCIKRKLEENEDNQGDLEQTLKEKQLKKGGATYG